MNLIGKTCGPWKVKERASGAAWLCARAGEEGLTAVHESFLLRLMEVDRLASEQKPEPASDYMVEAVRRRDERKRAESRLRSRQVAVAVPPARLRKPLPPIITPRSEPVREIRGKKRGPFVLLPLRRLASEPRLPDRGHYPGWPESFDPFGLLGGFNESRALNREAELAARRKA